MPIARFLSSFAVRLMAADCLVVCGPSGSGKSTLLSRLIKQFDNNFSFCVSHTTRRPRVGETDGKDYHFVSEELFQSMVAEKRFLEFTRFAEHSYGTSHASLERVRRREKTPVLDLELSGVQNLKKNAFRAKYVFIRPKSLQDLDRNLRNRKSEDEESVLRRLARAQQDMAFVERNPDFFDFVLINDDLETAFGQLKTFLGLE